MGNVRPWKMDDVLALFSWIFVGHTVFLLAGTTTFLSLIVVVVNSLQFQEYFAQSISDYLTKETGWKISFESAIIPRWRDGKLRLDNVSLVCDGDTWREYKREERARKGLPASTEGELDTNFTYFDVSVRHVDVGLSLWRWLDGRGLLTECTLKGVRGVVDRRHVVWSPDWVPTRRQPQPGDFEMDNFVVEDLLLTVLNPKFRPYTISIFNAELPRLRKQWLLYDAMCADSINGMFDNCLFSVHKPQRHDVVFEGGDREWAKISHLKMNGFPIEHLNHGTTGPFSWITRGTLDVDLQLAFPQTPNGDIIHLIKEEIKEATDVAVEKIEEVIAKHPERERIEEERRRLVLRAEDVPVFVAGDNVRVSEPVLTELNETKSGVEFFPQEREAEVVLPTGINGGKEDKGQQQQPKQMVMMWRVRLNDLKASVPLVAPELSYMGSALVRPVVAYMNAVRTSVGVRFSAGMELDNFNGAWTFQSAGLIDVLSDEIGRALTNMVRDERERARHLKRIGL
ncbi:Mitochondrial distribution and morphology protein 31, mitochondrial precursor, partial [Rhizophlyctis rosea]